MTRALALVGVALTAIGLIASMSTRAAAAPAHPVRNGVIAFWAYTKIYAIQPDGSKLRVLVPPRRRNCVIPSDRQGACSIGTFAWSPDGRRLAFLQGSSLLGGQGLEPSVDESLFRIDADGNHERRLPGCGHPWPSCGDFSWSPDGTHLVVSRFDGLYVVGVDDHSVRALTRSRTDSSPRWSPDGSLIAFVRRMHEDLGSSSAAYVVTAQGGRARRLPGTGQLGWDLQWAPDGASIVFGRGDGLLDAPADGSRRPATLLGHGVFQHPALSPDGKAVAYGSPWIAHQATKPHEATTARPEIWTERAGGKRRWRVYAGTVKEGGDLPLAPVWSPNGRRLAFADDALYVVNADGTHLRRLSTLGHESIGIGAEVAWQPIP